MPEQNSLPAGGCHVPLTNRMGEWYGLARPWLRLECTDQPQPLAVSSSSLLARRFFLFLSQLQSIVPGSTTCGHRFRRISRSPLPPSSPYALYRSFGILSLSVRRQMGGPSTYVFAQSQRIQRVPLCGCCVATCSLPAWPDFGGFRL